MGHSLTRFALTAGLAALDVAARFGGNLDLADRSDAHRSAVLGEALGDLDGSRWLQQREGHGVFDDADISKSSVDVTIDVSTVDTRTPDRDKDLKSDKFFDVAHYPTMTFKSTKVEQAGAGKLQGDRRFDDSRDDQVGGARCRWTDGSGEGSVGQSALGRHCDDEDQSAGLRREVERDDGQRRRGGR